MSQACEIPRQNASNAEMQQILASSKTVAVVGLSSNPERDSNRVATYLQQHGFKIFPVNPNESEVLGEKAYSHLSEVPEPVDIVNIFRKPEAVPGIVEEAIAKGAKSIWMQVGIVHNDAADRARAAGLKVVMGRCIMVEHWNQVANRKGSGSERA